MPAEPAWSSRRRESRHVIRNQGNQAHDHLPALGQSSVSRTDRLAIRDCTLDTAHAQCLSRNSLLLSNAQTTSSQALRRSLAPADVLGHACALGLASAREPDAAR